MRDIQGGDYEVIDGDKPRTEALAESLSKQTGKNPEIREPAGKDTYTPPPEPELKEPEAKSANQKLIKAIYTRAKDDFKLDHDNALRLVSAITERPIVSMENLSKDEASHVLDTLKHPDTVAGFLKEIKTEKAGLFDK